MSSGFDPLTTPELALAPVEYPESRPGPSCTAAFSGSTS